MQPRDRHFQCMPVHQPHQTELLGRGNESAGAYHAAVFAPHGDVAARRQVLPVLREDAAERPCEERRPQVGGNDHGEVHVDRG